MKQFITEIRGDYVYVVRNTDTDKSATGPCFCLTEESKAIKYADTLNRANGYPLLNPIPAPAFPRGRWTNQNS